VNDPAADATVSTTSCGEHRRPHHAGAAAGGRLWVISNTNGRDDDYRTWRSRPTDPTS